MKSFYSLLFVALLTCISCGKITTPEISDLNTIPEYHKAKDGVFIHVSSGYNNPQKVLMAVNLAAKMAESKDVALFFDVEGVMMLTKTSEDIEMANFMSLHKTLKKLVEMNVLIMACPMCIKKAGIDIMQLKTGVVVAEKEKFFNFTKGRILSLNY